MDNLDNFIAGKDYYDNHRQDNDHHKKEKCDIIIDEKYLMIAKIFIYPIAFVVTLMMIMFCIMLIVNGIIWLS